MIIYGAIKKVRDFQEKCFKVSLVSVTKRSLLGMPLHNYMYIQFVKALMF